MKTLLKFAALMAFLVPAPASAQQVLTLKGAPVSGGNQVTVGDVFDNAGVLRDVVLGYRSGASVLLDAATVQSVVGANGGYWANPRGQHRILVTAGVAAPEEPPAAAPRNPFANMPVAAVPATTAPVREAPQPVAALAGAMATAGHGPVVVHRQETIDVTWSAAGVSLTMSGVAQKDAATGDTVTVQNPTSKKMIDAVITGPGHAVAGPGADQYRALQLSSR